MQKYSQKKDSGNLKNGHKDDNGSDTHCKFVIAHVARLHMWPNFL